VELAAAGWSREAIVKELGRGRAWLGTKLNLKPMMALTMEGKIEPIGRVCGKEAARRARRPLRPMQCLVTSITPVIAAHTGIGAWGVFYQNEDGTNPETPSYD